MKRRAGLVVALALGAGMAGCGSDSGVRAGDARPPGASPSTTSGSTPTSTPSDDPSGSELEWGSCDRYEDSFGLVDLVGIDRSALQCATLSVPLDYADETTLIDLAVARRPADDPQRRIGSLVLNPGGPGGSGLEYLPQFVTEASEELLARFDIVSFDPRGVASSTPIDCLTDAEREAGFAEDPTPDNEAELADSIESIRRANASCVAQFPKLVPRMGTMNVARDLDRLRAALGDDRLTYLGLSYGTLIGAVYAELFPDRVRAVALDGSLSPDSGLEVLRDGQFAGFTNAFDQFVAACDNDPECPLDDARAAVEEVTARAAEEPIATLGDRPLTEAAALTAIAASLYDTESWPIVWGGIDSALDGDATVLSLLADLYVGRRPDGTWTNSDEAFNAVTCADYPERPTLAEIRPRADEILAEDEFWGPSFAFNPLGCEGAAAALEPIPDVLTAPDAPPIVVVGTRGDPATPYEWAVQMAESLTSGVLVTFEGNGHTAYGTSTCATRIVDDYLVSGTAPAQDQTCDE